MSRMNGYYEENNGSYDCSTQREYRNYNDCNCCQPTIVCEPKPATACCGVAGIYEALLALQESILRVNMPGFGVNVHIVTVTGQEYDVLFGNGVAITPIVKDGVLTYGTLVISLCDIAKMDIEINAINNPAFVELLNQQFRAITTKCRKVYGNEDVSRNCEDEYNYGACEGCSRCTQGIQNVANGSTPISQISYNGSLQPINAIPTLNSVATTTVIGSVAVSNTTGSFVSGANLATIGQSVVSNVTTIPQSVVTSISTTSVAAVTGITVATAAISGPITVTPTTVVTGVTLNPTTLVTNVNGSTATVVQSVTATTTTVLASVSAATTAFVTGVTGATTSVLISATPATAVFVTGVTTTSSPVISSIAPATTSVVASVNPATTTAVTGITLATTSVITNYANPTSVSGVLSGVNTITTITPTLETVATFTSTGTGPLQVVIPPNAFGNGIPPAAVTLNVAANGATISYDGNVSFYALPTATPVLGGATTATITNNVLTGLGTPSTIAAVTSVTPGTAGVVTAVNPTPIAVVTSVPTQTVAAVTAVSTTTAAAVTGITPAAATVLTGVTPATQAAVTGVTSSTVNVVNGVTAATVGAITSVVESTTQGNLVAAVTTGSVNGAATSAGVTVVTGVTPATSNISSVAGTVTGTVNSLQGVTAATVIGSVALNTTGANALTSVQVIGAGTTVVQGITTTTVQTLSPAPEMISGSVASAGNGILVINDTNGNISIYSECEITTING